MKNEESEVENLKAIIKTKAEKHSMFYRNLCGDVDTERKMAEEDGSSSAGRQRQRRTGVYEMGEGTIFKSVKELRENYLKKLEATAKKLGEKEVGKDSGVDETLLVPPPSGYCSGSDDERWCQKVRLPLID